MHTLELKIPPVAQFLVVAGLMCIAALALPFGAFRIPGQLLVSSIILLAAGVVGMASVRVFARVGTTVNPLRPHAAQSLVTHGIYRYTRNPMYLALLLALVALGTWLGSFVALALVPLFVVAMNRLQIRPEERALEALFGDEFTAYREATRRWL